MLLPVFLLLVFLLLVFLLLVFLLLVFLLLVFLLLVFLLLVFLLLIFVSHFCCLFSYVASMFFCWYLLTTLFKSNVCKKRIDAPPQPQPRAHAMATSHLHAAVQRNGWVMSWWWWRQRRVHGSDNEDDAVDAEGHENDESVSENTRSHRETLWGSLLSLQNGLEDENVAKGSVVWVVFFVFLLRLC